MGAPGEVLGLAGWPNQGAEPESDEVFTAFKDQLSLNMVD